MKELVKHIVERLVDYPEEISVEEIEGETTTVIELRVAKTDLGKVIGKEGRIAKAIRTIMNATTNRERKKSVLEIVE